MRQDALLLAIYRRLGKITGETDDISELTHDWLDETVRSHEDEIDAWEESHDDDRWESDPYAGIVSVDG